MAWVQCPSAHCNRFAPYQLATTASAQGRADVRHIPGGRRQPDRDYRGRKGMEDSTWHCFSNEGNMLEEFLWWITVKIWPDGVFVCVYLYVCVPRHF